MTQPPLNSDSTPSPAADPLPAEDELLAFLRHHAPAPPPASPHLEQQIMSLVEGTRPAHPSEPLRWQDWGWTTSLTAALAASTVLAVWIGQWLLGPTVPNTATLANLETFWEGNWQGIIVAPSSELAAQADWLILSRSSDGTGESLP